jgi:hypothetical protein
LALSSVAIEQQIGSDRVERWVIGRRRVDT